MQCSMIRMKSMILIIILLAILSSIVKGNSIINGSTTKFNYNNYR